MKITIYKSRKLQVSEYEPYEFGYGLEQELPITSELYKDADKMKQAMEIQVDKWIEKETEKWEKYKKFTGQVATPIKERTDDIPF